MLTRDQQREILAIGILALAAFVLLALLPVAQLGGRAGEWFPSGNAMGLVGARLQGVLRAFLGASAYLVPPFLVLGGLRLGGWLSREWTGRLAILDSGLLLLVPVATWVLLEAPDASGWLGLALGQPLVELVGVLGAMLVTGTGFVALSVGTLRWNPLRALGRGVAAGSGFARRTASGLVDRGRGYAKARAEAAALAAAKRDQPSLSAQEAGLFADAEAGERSDDGVDEGPAPDEDEPDAAPSGTLATDGAKVNAPEPQSSTEPKAGEESSADAGPAVAGDERTGTEGLATTPAPAAELEDVPLPGMELLTPPERGDRDDMERQLDRLGAVLVEKLRTFNVRCELGGRTTGPVVTQFEVIPAPGVKVNRIASLDADLALAMKAPSVRIVAPIPGKGAVGVEIPNPKPEIVNLREILEAPAFRRARSDLPLALGKDLTGRPYVTKLEKMPHVLIAGATGSGKSVCLNTIVTSLVYRHTPETLRLLMIDPKMVELSIYSRLPHLRHAVVTDPRDAAGVLKWAVLEMEHRYGLLKANHVRSIAEFNKKVRDGVLMRRAEARGREGDEDRWIYSDGVMPYVVVVVDELADLMMTVQSEVEKPLTQLAQKARAIGIHLIVATQRPSVNVITGLIKANFPTRIAFRVASKTDSRTILDQNGADALLGNGDMLFLPPGESEPVRIQGAFLPTQDTEQLMAWYIERQQRLVEAREEAEAAKADRDEHAEPDILDQVRTAELEEAAHVVEDASGDWDELFRAAAEVCVQNGGGSTSLLQRRLKIGYGRAARIVDQLQEAGVLGPSEGAKGRDVLVDLDGLELICASRGLADSG